MATTPKSYVAKIGVGKQALAREVTLELAPNGSDDGTDDKAASDGPPSRWNVSIDGKSQLIDAHRLPNGSWSLIVDGLSWVVDLDTAKNGALLVAAGGDASLPVQLTDPRREKLGKHVLSKKADGPSVMRAQMPGKIIKVVTKVGAKVTAGQGLVLVEAMKMENELVAAKDGVVSEIHVAEGQTVEAHEALVTLAPAE